MIHRLGNKASADSIKRTEHESGGARSEAFDKESGKVQVELNDKAGQQFTAS